MVEWNCVFMADCWESAQGTGNEAQKVCFSAAPRDCTVTGVCGSCVSG